MNHSGARPVPGGIKLRRGHLIVAAVVALIALLAAASLLYLAPLLALLDSHPSTAPAHGVPTPAAPPPPLTSSKPINILLLGSDNDQKFQGNAVLSQTMIVVSIDPAAHRVTLLSIPRDLWVAIPGHGSAKIDLAYAEGGAPLARAAVEQTFKIPIHYYAWIGLNGLVAVVDRLGGVDIDVLHPVLDDNYPNDFSSNGYGTERVYLAAGPQHLDGRHALQYVRSRHGDLLSDFGRSIRQQQLLLAMQQKMGGMDMVLELPAFARDLNGHVKTDLDLVRLTQFALFMRGLHSDDVRQAFLTPFMRDAHLADGQAILQADWPALDAYLHQLFGGNLYASKGRRLYLFTGTRVVALLKGAQVKDPALTPDGSRLAFSRLSGESAVIMLADASGQQAQAVTPASGPEGQLWAFGASFSTDGRHLVYLTDRGKLKSSPQNLQPNDLGVWTYDASTGASRQLVWPVPYSGGDSDPSYRPGTTTQLFYTTYLYGGQPLVPVARLTTMSLTTGVPIFLSPDGARNFEPAISPDGHFMAFVHATATEDDLYVMPLQASYLRESQPFPSDSAVLLQRGIVSQPVWSADGSTIAFMMLVKGSFDLFLLPVSTAGSIHAAGQPQVVTQGSYLDADSRLAWGP